MDVLIIYIFSVGELFEFLGAVFISASTALICYLIITKNEYYKENVLSPATPTIV